MAIVFVLGLIVGSFLNVVIWRLQTGESVAKGRSYCPRCRHQLAWYDLMPVLSFAMLRGRCRYCKKPISIQYPLVELGTAMVFFLIANYQFPLLRQGFGGQVISNEIAVGPAQFASLLYLFAIASLLIVIFVYDLKHFLIPDKILFPAIGLAFAWKVFEHVQFSQVSERGLVLLDPINMFFGFGIVNPLMNALFAALIGFGFFLAVFAVSRGRWMGFGDVKLALFMGLFLGWPNLLVALFVAFVVGAIIGIVLISLKRKGLKSEVPFGPFLIFGTLAAFLWGDFLLQKYFEIIMFA
ncbi:MAG: prepilin peptidase [Candidatus Wildermuthbacteria bacterium]|nr:prepilin peptidase [Candidatus Wildermuthbacteria bacterium]